MFGKKPSVQDQLRQQSKDLRKTERDLVRDRRELERQEKQIELEIKKAAKQGNKQVCTVLAKQLIQIRKQKGRSLTASSKVMSIGTQSKTMNANMKLAGAMATTSKTMGAMNKQINPEQIMKTMQEFEKENTKMEMKEEIMEDTLNSVFEESGDEEEQDQIVTQVLDEIGIEITGKMSKAPTSHLGDKLPTGQSKQTYTDEEIEKKLAALKT